MGRILFVDDDTEGWELINKHDYDLIFVDLNIPGMSGFELLGKTRQMKKTKKVPVVVISAMPEEAFIDEVMEAGANLFLEKPIALVNLLSVIDKFESESSK